MEFTPERILPADPKPFAVEDLFDFSNDDGALDAHSDVLDSCNSSSASAIAAPVPPPDADYRTFSSDICLHYDDAAELEWLSNFVEEDSFSSEDLKKLHLISGLSNSSGPTKARPDPIRHLHSDANNRAPPINNAMLRPETLPVPAKARSKRSRAAPGSWASRLHQANQPTVVFPKPEPDTEMALSPTFQPGPILKPVKKKGGGEAVLGHNTESRRCLHCATDKTPQWRTGPMGPKTLCNACGVRYKSGRLVPEYRPAASPTFVLTKHSNSHRKVMELRRQKETGKGDHHHYHYHHHAPPPHFIHGAMVFDNVSNSDEYLIHQHVGPDFRQLI